MSASFGHYRDAPVFSIAVESVRNREIVYSGSVPGTPQVGVYGYRLVLIYALFK